MRLVSMTDFVVLMRENKVKDNIRRFWACERYATFLKKPLTLGMFVSCVDDEVFNYSKHGNKEDYDKAKERVLFEGFEIEGDELHLNGLFYIYICDLEFWDVEDIINVLPYVNLTQSAIKQIGL